MFENYADIFTRRGADYDAAMSRCPNARQAEFEAILDIAAPQPGVTLIDLPAEGGYLCHYLDSATINLIAIEPSPAFHTLCRSRVANTHLAPLDCLPLPDNHADIAVSLTGLHHALKRLPIFLEVARILRPDGRFAIAEVDAESAVAAFLNQFVHRYNPNGHIGLFADAGYRNDLLLAGFELTRDDICRYHWRFASRQEMARYLTLLFGLTLADESKVIEGVERHLGYALDAQGGVHMNWSLRRLLAVKPAASQSRRLKS
jgi:SAM-dependent methyltransferase